MVNHVLASLGRPVQQPVERADVISCVATTPLIQWNLSFRPFDTQAGVQYSKNSPIGGGRLIPTESVTVVRNNKCWRENLELNECKRREWLKNNKLTGTLSPAVFRSSVSSLSYRRARVTFTVSSICCYIICIRTEQFAPDKNRRVPARWPAHAHETTMRWAKPLRSDVSGHRHRGSGVK